MRDFWKRLRRTFLIFYVPFVGVALLSAFVTWMWGSPP